MKIAGNFFYYQYIWEKIILVVGGVRKLVHTHSIRVGMHHFQNKIIEHTTLEWSMHQLFKDKIVSLTWCS